MDHAASIEYINSVLAEYSKTSMLMSRDYRRSFLTAKDRQIVLMTLLPKEDIPSEVHKDKAQCLYVLKGKMYSHIGDVVQFTEAGHSVFIPPGTRHYIANGSTEETLHIISLYSPPEWPEIYVERRQRAK